MAVKIIVLGKHTEESRKRFLDLPDAEIIFAEDISDIREDDLANTDWERTISMDVITHYHLLFHNPSTLVNTRFTDVLLSLITSLVLEIFPFSSVFHPFSILLPSFPLSLPGPSPSLPLVHKLQLVKMQDAASSLKGS